MFRTIGAIVAGFVTWTVVYLGGNQAILAAMRNRFDERGGTDDPAVLGAILALSAVCCALAGLVTAAIARQPLRAAAVLGGILLVVGVAVQTLYWDLLPLWYHLTFLAMLLPLTVAGALPRAARPR